MSDTALINLVMATIATGTVGLAVWLIKDNRLTRRETRASADRTDSLLTKALLVLLRNQLIAAHKVAVAGWTITTAEKQSFLEIHQLYLDLSGNGSTSHLIDDIQRIQPTA